MTAIDGGKCVESTLWMDRRKKNAAISRPNTMNEEIDRLIEEVA